MSTQTDRLLQIAQRLDELSDEEGLAELEDLSESIGEVVEALNQAVTLGPEAYGKATMPRYLAEIQQIIERTLKEQRFGTYEGYRREMDMHVRMNVPFPNNTADLIKSIQSGV